MVVPYERIEETRLSADIYHDNKLSRSNNPHDSKAFRYLISLFRLFTSEIIFSFWNWYGWYSQSLLGCQCRFIVLKAHNVCKTGYPSFLRHFRER